MDKIEIYQFKVYLKNISPMIWRRFLIQNTSTLQDLHYVIQILMGWTDYHLNEFVIKGRKYTIPNGIGYPSSCGEYGTHILLETFKFRKNDKFLYFYDFTSEWEFEIRLELIEPPKSKKRYPVCLSGSGASPKEGCGGPERFDELKEHWSLKAYDIFLRFLKVLVDEKKSEKRLKDTFDMNQLREACYWLRIDKYERKTINNFLTLYAKKDDRWQEAFDEVIEL